MANWLSVSGYNEFAAPARGARNQLSTVWEEEPEETPHVRFWMDLVNQNLDNMINDPDKFILKHLRYDHEMLKRYEGHFGEGEARANLPPADRGGVRGELGIFARKKFPCK